MGVEPTAACSAQPATNFEDWGAHRDTITPTDKFSAGSAIWVMSELMVNVYFPGNFATGSWFWRQFPGKRSVNKLTNTANALPLRP